MSDIHIIVKEILENTLAVTEDSGSLLFNEICSKFDELDDTSNDKIILDFSGIELITTAFLNKCIGIDLFKKFNIDKVGTRLKITNIPDEDTLKLFKLVLGMAITVKQKEQSD